MNVAEKADWVLATGERGRDFMFIVFGFVAWLFGGWIVLKMVVVVVLTY